VDFSSGATKTLVLRSLVLVVWPHPRALTVEEVVVIGLETYVINATSQAIGQAIAQTKLMAAARVMEVARDTVAKVKERQRRRVEKLLAVQISMTFQELVKVQVQGTHHIEVAFSG